MAEADAGRCLSDHPDDLYLDSGSFVGGCSTADEEREAFRRGAEEALAAAAALGPIKRLTFSIAEDSKMILLTRRWSEHCRTVTENNLMAALISNPAARRVEELHIDVKALNTQFTLSFAALPSEALRVLRIARCAALTAGAGAGAVFPVLVDLHLQDCSVPLADLQSIVDAAPRLSTLHLVSCFFSTKANYAEVVEQLMIPAVSTLVLTDCTYGYKSSLELDVPSLQCFTYRGHIDYTNRLWLKSSLPSTIHVDLHLTHDHNAYIYGPTPPARELFWRFIQNFNTTKLLKLRIDYFTMDDLALIDKVSRDELLGGLSFSLLEQLELEAEYKPASKTSMVVLADLLHCCPMVRDLRIKLIKQDESPWIIDHSIDMEARMRFDKSVSAFKNRRRRRSMVSLAGQNDDNNDDAFGIHGLTGEHSFSCLQSRLERVSLQFFRDEPNCLGVQLAKFFAENAMVLQELHIDDGCQEMLEHVNSRIQRWLTQIMANQLKVTD